jgi:peroxiredoxin
LRRYKDQLNAEGARILLVGMGTVEQTAAFVNQLAIPFPMACDSGRAVYKAFSLKRMSPLIFLLRRHWLQKGWRQ